MFGLFGKKSEKDKLMKQYNRLLEEAFNLSKSNRTASDAKTAEANEILNQIEKLSE